ncbi:CRISPR-associated protein Cas1 [hydrothermal vent metagenome]|uniref:CRISPR-associated protein Cas1 n=1 Tax=hydrothermal vent metagenome TaxID=652676 RepID=A0A1W1DXY6_9ZZZZ
MSWQTLLISNPCKLSIKNGNILLKRLNDEDALIAISEVSAIVIENPQVTLTAVFMVSCASQNIAVIFSDKKYTPIGVFQPFYQHSRMTKHAFLQRGWSESFKNRAWQKLVKAKIHNQQQTLVKITKQPNKQLNLIASKVQSADKTNREAHAATVYWRILFENFRRNNANDIRNSALDYGYSIVRSAIARSVSASGFVPAFGFHHKNELNAFNLVDDLIEPFRPFIDHEVYLLNQSNESTKLTYQMRTNLVNILNKKIMFKQKKTTLLNAIQQMVFSLLKASEVKDIDFLLLPEHVQPK